ncbi:MAG: hypothetical protein ACK4ND_06110 [Cytophagaceae bacterium]
MKKMMTIIICIFFFGLFDVNAQSINGLPIEAIDSDYIEVGYAPRQKKVVQMDLGSPFNDKIYTSEYKRSGILGGYRGEIKDENGEIIEFETKIDLINFFSKHGFKVTASYAEDDFAVHFILERR